MPEAHERTSGVASETVRVPIGPWAEMGQSLREQANELGFDLMRLETSTTTKGQAGTPSARYEGRENGVALYTVYRRTGRDGK